jgi:hypothetical protein
VNGIGHQLHDEINIDVFVTQLHKGQREKNHHHHVVGGNDLKISLDRTAEEVGRDHVGNGLEHHQEDDDARNEGEDAGQPPDSSLDHSVSFARVPHAPLPMRRTL